MDRKHIGNPKDHTFFWRDFKGYKIKDVYPQARKLFLSKVLQYIKERLLDAKYACGFLFNIIGSHPLEFKANKHLLQKPQRRRNWRPRKTQKNQTEKRKWILPIEGR
ncbi:uncharacterized protein LOC131256482 [Magnolia sinica]|uniref:uncharacterized protein LOC131256482 n=1 Tax=Magnolia sinica TaxID=86752 RepID=UPI00265A66D2|nr:uncharacterized protein LOC131256482 [Magnolia sinica]XP_058113347.1 uncharacterized protein LOC131256482 [Magnolia sinica]